MRIERAVASEEELLKIIGDGIHLGAFIREIRRRTKTSQRSLAKIIGCKGQSVHRHENATRPLKLMQHETLWKNLASWLGVNRKHLFIAATSTYTITPEMVLAKEWYESVTIAPELLEYLIQPTTLEMLLILQKESAGKLTWKGVEIILKQLLPQK